MKLGVYIHGSSPFKPKETVSEYITLAKQYETDGFDSLWFADHLIRTPDPNKSPLYEAWSLIAGLSMVTEKIRFGTLVSPITFRNIGVFAKLISTIDHLNNGRTIVGLGNGWFDREHSMFDVSFGTVKSRMDILESYLQNLIALWTDDDVTSTEQSPIKLKNAYLNPKPIQKPSPPILIGGGGEKRTLKMVAKYAQMSNFGGSIENLVHKLSVLENHCENVGRNFKEIIPTTNRAVIIGKSAEEVSISIENYRNRLGELGMTVPSLDDFGKNRLIGTPEQIAEQIAEINEIGIKMIILTINDQQSEMYAGELLRDLK